MAKKNRRKKRPKINKSENTAIPISKKKGLKNDFLRRKQKQDTEEKPASSLISEKKKSLDLVKEIKSRPPEKKKLSSLGQKISDFFRRVKLPNFEQLRLVPHSINKLEKRLILIFSIIIVAGLALLGWQKYPDYIEETAQVGGSYTEGTVGQPKYINPILAPTSDVNMDLTELIYSGLLRYDRHQKLQPDLAESYEVSDDKKEYTFHLRQDIVWHDGEPLSADDVVYTVQTIKNPEFKSPLRPEFQGVEIEKIDDYTVKFTLVEETYAPFLSENSTFGILPRHLWEEVVPKNASLTELNLEPIGTGPFKFKEYTKDKKNGTIISYTLERNENFHLGAPYLEELHFNFYADQLLLAEAYNNKEIQGFSYLDNESKEVVDNKRLAKLNLISLKLPRYYAIFFNQVDSKPLKDLEVRRALAYATDKEKIIQEVLNGEALPVDSPILPNFLGYNPEQKTYPYNPQRAKESLEKAGWKEGADNAEGDLTRWKDGVGLTINLSITNSPEFEQIAEILKKDWAEIGINTVIESYEPTELQANHIRPRDYEALLYGQLLLHDPDPYPFWHSSQREDPGLNLTSFKDTNVDDLLDTARRETDDGQRRLKYLNFQNIIAEKVPALFLYCPTYLYPISEKIKGVDISYITIPSDRFADVHQWYRKVDRHWKD